MNLKTQKIIAAKILKVGINRVWVDSSKGKDIKKAITKNDIRSLIAEDAIKKKQKVGVSRVRAKKTALQKKKGRKKGKGSREGKKTSRLPRKRAWINKIRPQRAFLKLLRDKRVIDMKDYKGLKSKVKGGFFRSKRHIKLYADERSMLNKNGK